MAAKILVIGATNGRFIEAFTKVAALHTKNNFSLALLLGDLFSAPTSPTSDDETVQRLLRGEVKVPLPTYFGLGKYSLPESVRERVSCSGEVCENLFFLGKKTILNTSEGVRIVALGGRLDSGVATSGRDGEAGGGEAENLPFYSAQDAKSLKGANTADLLLTYEWPADIARNSAISGALEGNSTVAELAAAIRPRYHFVPAGATFWEREPYRNSMKGGEGQGDIRVTRFLGVGEWGNANKAKSLYAFSINPKDTNTMVPVNATGPPYRFDKGKKRTAEEASGSGSFFWGEHVRDERGGKRGSGRGGRGREARPPPGPGNCFFCLSYPQLEKHLIVSIGNEAYVTTAKGPLTNPAHNPPTLPFSSHVLIIPLTHTPTLSLIDDTESKDNTLKEMIMYKESVEKMLEPRGCGAVTFEISRAGGVHGHWQVVPVPLSKLSEVEAAFKAEAEADKLQGFEKREVTEEDGDFFRVWVSGEEGSLVCPLIAGEYFDLQFGRRVLAKVLGLKTVHWKDCVLSLEEETKDAGKFKDAFKEFDFSL